MKDRIKETPIKPQVRIDDKGQKFTANKLYTFDEHIFYGGVREVETMGITHNQTFKMTEVRFNGMQLVT